MGLSSLLEKAHLSHKDEDPEHPPSATLAPGQGEAAEDDSDAASDSDDDDDEASKKALRTYDIVVRNSTTFPIQMVAWPVRASKNSDYELTTYRGAKIHTEVPPSGTIFTDEEVKLGTTRGPRGLDFRKRWVWVYFDLVTPHRKIHLQGFVKTDRKGIEVASLGRTDLDSTKDNHQSSGSLGSVIIDNDSTPRRAIFVVDASLKDVENTVDDTTEGRKVSSIRGKGIETNSWVSLGEGRSSLIVGKEARYHEYADPVHPARLSTLRTSVHRIDGVGSKTVAAFVEHGGNEWWKGLIKVHPVTGIATGKGFDSTSESTVVFHPTPKIGAINYGFHDAGEGRRSQIYLYATPDQSNWLGDFIAEDPRWLEKPFSVLALPAAHDAGMYGPLDGGLAALIEEGHLGNALANHVAANIASPVIRSLVDLLELIKLRPERVIGNIAMTQKDSIEDQLKIGVRFFDFRPGFAFHDVIHTRKGRIHHQHAIVPGCTYLTFLLDILNFLATRPSEIVVVELKSDGFVIREDKLREGKLVVYSMIPSPAELDEVWEEARNLAELESAREIVRGGPEDMSRSIGELIKEKRRIIVVDQVHQPGCWVRGDSYDHVAYNTDEPAPIIASLEKTHAESSHAEEAPTEGKPPRGCIYQLQATPTANLLDDVFASLTYSDSSSLLTYVK
ncbi:PLC-like phosphodiesterase, partial [Leucosporidium creatinivorum]